MGQVLPTAKTPRTVDLHFERGPDLKDVAKDDTVGRSDNTKSTFFREIIKRAEIISFAKKQGLC